jgi:voltage-gated potassium channel Kch
VDNSSGGSLRTYLIYIITLVALVALLGAFGFHFFEKGHNPNVKTIWHSLWWVVVTMTTIGYGDIVPQTPGGRIVAVLVMLAGIGTLGVTTAAIAAFLVKNDLILLLRISRTRRHVVICGLGNKGLLLAKAFRERGLPVVVIERDSASPFIEPCREQGAMVLAGDATEPEVLTRARVPEARYLIAVCGDDGANAEVAAHARDLAGQHQGHVLTCSTHIVDPELWYLLRRWELSQVGSFRLQFFNVFDIGARALLIEHPPFHEGKGPHGRPPHLLVVGAEKLGQNLVLHAARLWRDLDAPGNERLRITIVDRETARLKESLHLQYPGLEEACEIHTQSIDLRSPEFHEGAFLYDSQKRFSVTAVYVCVEEDALGLSAALALVHRAHRHHCPVVVRMTQDAGLATLLHDAREGGKAFSHLHAFGLLERTCQPELVLGGTNELLARATHEKWRRDQEKLGEKARSNPAYVPWEKLPEELKESNRKQADHIGIKLQSIGCDIAPLTRWETAPFLFTPEEVEQLAEMEHERWKKEREAQGFRYGPRDPARKTNPSLVPWAELPEETREFNREEIRGLPESLAEAGFQIYRLDRL